MTVYELIQELLKHPLDAKVVLGKEINNSFLQARFMVAVPATGVEPMEPPANFTDTPNPAICIYTDQPL